MIVNILVRHMTVADPFQLLMRRYLIFNLSHIEFEVEKIEHEQKKYLPGGFSCGSGGAVAFGGGVIISGVSL